MGWLRKSRDIGEGEGVGTEGSFRFGSLKISGCIERGFVFMHAVYCAAYGRASEPLAWRKFFVMGMAMEAM